MTRFYAIDEANGALPEVERILAALRDQREELIALRDRVVAASPPDDEAPTADVAERIRLLRLGMQGLIDQMQAGVARLVELDITLRDISTGPDRLPGPRQRPADLAVLATRRDATSRIGIAHDEGFDTRRPLSELPMGRGSGTPAA